MTKRVQLPALQPPELNSESNIERFDSKWVYFPNGKRRRKASLDEHVSKRFESFRRKRERVSASRVCGKRWCIEEIQSGKSCVDINASDGAQVRWSAVRWDSSKRFFNQDRSSTTNNIDIFLTFEGRRKPFTSDSENNAVSSIETELDLEAGLAPVELENHSPEEMFPDDSSDQDDNFAFLESYESSIEQLDLIEKFSSLGLSNELIPFNCGERVVFAPWSSHYSEIMICSRAARCFIAENPICSTCKHHQLRPTIRSQTSFRFKLFRVYGCFRFLSSGQDYLLTALTYQKFICGQNRSCLMFCD